MNDQLKMDSGKTGGALECLGMTFPSEDARREHFLGLLAEKLKDAAFRNQEGFPQGSDEAILAMSDPPYYTACPNPWLLDFIEHHRKPDDPLEQYTREPLAVDVSEGKTDAVYKAHAYHTKVPHLAIVPSILHYTEPGDIVLDCFAGTGMTGVAAQFCGTAPLDYRRSAQAHFRGMSMSIPKWGVRHSILCDLSPAASFISYNYLTSFDVVEFGKLGQKLLTDIQEEIGWMYQTHHRNSETPGLIEYTVWSEIFSCPECSGEINFISSALEFETKRVLSEFNCPSCSANLKKSQLERIFLSQRDHASDKIISVPKRAPSLIVYKHGGKRFEKVPDDEDLRKIAEIEQLPLHAAVPNTAFPYRDMWEARRMRSHGITNIHHMFLPRAALALGAMWQKAQAVEDLRIRHMMLFMIEQGIRTFSLRNSYEPLAFSQNDRGQKGAYYIPSQHSEVSPWYFFEGKLKRLLKTFSDKFSPNSTSYISTSSARKIPLSTDSVDYIFTDPPFGENFPYAELNFTVEAWHGVFTDSRQDAVVDRSKENKAAQKSIDDYRSIMAACFKECHRVLKSGRWMTVVFSNTQASVWNSIQTALQEAGFVVSNVSALDKKQGSFKAVTTTVAVKQDLVISAYKPDGGLERRFEEQGGSEESVWDFVQTHLKQLPVSKSKGGALEFVVERDPRILFDRMIAWFVRHNTPVPLSSQEFQDGLRQKFAERDGMVFLAEQAVEYDRKRAQVTESPQIELFISDERSAIDWLTDFLRKRPSTYQELQPEFFGQLGAGWRKHEAKPELSNLLEANFLLYAGNGDVPSQIHSYLSTNFKDLRGLEKDDLRLKAKAKDRWYAPDPSKAKDLEQKRERSLLKEFENYKSAPGRKLKEFRLEVLRAGFKTAWGTKDYKTIIGIAQKIPEDALQEDEKLLLWYDQALTRMEADA